MFIKLYNSIGQKQRKRIGQFDLSSPWANSSGTVSPVLSTPCPWADSTVVPSANKVQISTNKVQ